MHFELIDRVLELSADRVVAIKQVSRAEEYLQDHFADFPVLPGVFMVETLVQAARKVIDGRGGVSDGRGRYVLGSVRAMKYGAFVKPGEVLRVEVTLSKQTEDGGFEFKGEGSVQRDGVGDPLTAVSGRFMLRPVRVG